VTEIEYENIISDQKELDDIIFDILGLTQQERKEVYIKFFITEIKRSKVVSFLLNLLLVLPNIFTR